MAGESFQTRVVIGLALVGVMVMVGSLGDSSPQRAKPSARKGFDEVPAVTDCDIAAQRELLSPDSMDKAWNWSVDWSGVDGHAMIERDFSAKNAFSVPLPFHYRCKVHGTTGRLLDVKVVDGYR